MTHIFGGEWTTEKLSCLDKYLQAYQTIMKKKQFRTVYIDAFAGSGQYTPKTDTSVSLSLFDDDPDVLEYAKGSARIALEIPHPFDTYVFIDHKKEYTDQLVMLRDEFPGKDIRINTDDANSYLLSIPNIIRGHNNLRGVLFLDSYGAKVEFDTLKGIANTGVFDVWYLFPLGMGLNRLLSRKWPPPEGFARRLDLMLGDDGWRNAFYESIKSSSTS